MIRVSDEVRDAATVVALETTLVAHGFPPGEGIEVALESERRVRGAGAVPATIGVLEGEIRVGLSEEELDRFTAEARKVGPRDLAGCVVSGETGATTVGATLAVCRQAGIRFMGTGGIGGVHRGNRLDVSADLLELSRTRAVVVSSGAKSLLDVEATAEMLETLGVPTLGYRTDTLPRFYDAEGGPAVSQRVESVDVAVAIARAHWELGGAGVLLANAPPRSIDVDELIESALNESVELGTTGQGLTPFILGRLHDESGGETLEVNRALIAANAQLAAELAVAAQ
ncbi:MAG TPA: pseudouridine-5'-phosphate glycosidase [Gaiellaceae bacterium]|nr:pseudouridine-5'-phosphate glycosidase [Gaiellaceae bacterium]